MQNFGGQTKCIMGNVEMANSKILGRAFQWGSGILVSCSQTRSVTELTLVLKDLILTSHN